MAGRAAAGHVYFCGALRAPLLTVASLVLLTGVASVPAVAGLPLPPASSRGRIARRPVLQSHPLAERIAYHPHSVRHAPVHRVLYHHAGHPAVHVARVHGRWERVEHGVHPVARRATWRHTTTAMRMSCVPFARADSGITLAGDAYAWWNHAAGMYARGDAPVPGSVLAFRANVRMRLGHVAVVSRVINRREVEVDQSNWGNGGAITRDVPVIDVSENNDWTEVRVSLGDGRFGSVYPTYGFIYNRPDTGTMLASRRTPAPEIAANPAPSDLRPLYRGGDEVADLPGPLPAPPHWPARLGHRLRTNFAHRDVRHVAYRHPVTHWAPHHASSHRVVLHHVALNRAPAQQPDSAP